LIGRRASAGPDACLMSADWTLYSGARSVELRVSLDWHEHQKILKFSFPMDVQNPKPTYQIACDFIVRKANGDEDSGGEVG
jgi:alpha-mannosidase